MTQQHGPCVLVEVSGPDPKLVKSTSAPFHAGKDGRTRLSSSGFLVTAPGLQSPLVVTGLTALYPFLTQPARHNLLAASHSSLVIKTKIEGFAGEERGWFGLCLVGFWEATGVRQVLAALLQAPSVAGHGGWRVGWPPPQQDQQLQQQNQHRDQSQEQQGPSGQADGQAGQGQSLWRGRGEGVQWAALAPYVAILALEPGPAREQLQGSALALGSKPARALIGEQLQALGSPFGVLAPAHFFGFVSTGIISNLFSSEGSRDTDPSLLAADLRCLPGMEGGAVVGSQGQLLGMLGPPLTSSLAQAQVALVIPAAAVAAAVAAAAAALAREGRGGGADSNAAGAAGATGASLLPRLPPALPYSQQRHGEGGAVAAAASLRSTAGPRSHVQRQQQEGQQHEQRVGGLGAALRSVVAVAVGGSWASGVIISPQGHLLTNAHLFEPRGHPPQLRIGPPVAPAIQQTTRAADRAADSALADAWPAHPGQHLPQQQPALDPPNPPGAASALCARHPTNANAPPHLLQLSPIGSRPYPVARVLVPSAQPGHLPGSESAPGMDQVGAQWHAADVLYIFQGPLDLAVLQLRSAGPSRAPSFSTRVINSYPPSPSPAAATGMAWTSFSPSGSSSGSSNSSSSDGGSGSSSGGGTGSSSGGDGGTSSTSSSGGGTAGNRALGMSSAAESDAWPALRLASEEEISPGVPACVAGYPLFNPSGQLGPWLTQGIVARVLAVGGEPAMLLTTAGVHSGASGGAVLDPHSCALLGLVTSNAKHANGAIYPHLNFSIPAGLLRAVCELAAGSTAGGAASLVAACAALDAELSRDEMLCALWGLTFSAGKRQGEGEGEGPRLSSGPRQGPGEGFGGARPPPALLRLLKELGGREEASKEDAAAGAGKLEPKSKL